MDKELKNCPFCKGEAYLDHETPFMIGKAFQYSVGCYSCGVSTAYYDYEEEAIKAWNRRVKEKDNLEALNRLPSLHDAIQGIYSGCKYYRQNVYRAST